MAARLCPSSPDGESRERVAVGKRGSVAVMAALLAVACILTRPADGNAMQAAQCAATPPSGPDTGEAAADVAAVLRHAAMLEAAGRLDGARLVLETFFGCHRDVGAAWAELRRIYALLARAAYARALGAADTPAAAAQQPDVQPPPTAPQAVAAGQSAPDRPAPSSANGGASSPAAQLPAGAQGAVRSAAAARVEAPAGAGSRAEDVVRQRTLEWARAWQARDVEQYLGFYAPGFVGRGAGSPEKWAAARRAVIGGAGEITVTLRDLAVSRVDPSTVEVRFRQLYATPRSSLESSKSLVWRNVDGIWGIVAETVERERRR